MEHGVYKGSHLNDKALGIALCEEAERQITPDTMPIVDDGALRVLVPAEDSPVTAQPFHTRLIAIGGMTAFINRTDHAVAKLHYADRGVHVACRADSGVNHDTCH